MRSWKVVMMNLLSLIGVMVVMVVVESSPTTVPILRPPEDELVMTTEVSDVIVIDNNRGEFSQAEDGTTNSPVPENNESRPDDDENLMDFDVKDCYLPKVRGPCRAIIDSYFFNTATKACEPFSWSGCGGNNNRFSSLEKCQLQCTSLTPPSENDVANNGSMTTTSRPPLGNKHRRPICPKFTGCGDGCVIIQDPSDGGCRKCICGEQNGRAGQIMIVSPGSNVTITKKTEVSIGSVSGVPSVTDDEDDGPKSDDGNASANCLLPKERGNCRGMMTRFHYDPKHKNCVEFHYGGCEGNLNNFVTKAKCLEYCKGQ